MKNIEIDVHFFVAVQISLSILKILRLVRNLLTLWVNDLIIGADCINDMSKVYVHNKNNKISHL